LKYIITYTTKFGTVSAESDYADDLLVGYQTLKQLASKLESSPPVMNRQALKGVRRSRQGPAKASSRNVRRQRSKGKGETTNILRELETNVLRTSFFQRQRSTGETKAKLDEVAGGNFTSRKVSQALGILWQKGELKRTGKRNYFVYSK
jgi:hypothetical protein